MTNMMLLLAVVVAAIATDSGVLLPVCHYLPCDTSVW